MPQEETNPKAGDPVEQPASGGTPGETPNSQDPQDEEEVQDVKSLPKWAQEKIAKANSEARERRLALQKQEQEAKAKSDAELAAKQEWEKLAKSREQEIATLKPQAEEATQLNELLAARINADIAKWPKEVTDTAPEGEVSAVEMAKWADKMRPLAEKLMAASATPTEKPKPKGGIGPGPTPSGSGSGAPTPAGNAAVAPNDIEEATINRF